jgi:predicted DCC family thiol-disulfide oxidoreductase YuxK
MQQTETIQHPVILFDGVCNLCSGAVQFIIKRDKKNLFKFASLQSAFGQDVLNKYNLPTHELSSFILLENDGIYTRSTGALKVAKQLSGGWPLLYAFIIVPRFIRDGVYNYVAKNRYRWFGKKQECWLPTPTLKNKFLN